MIAASGDSVHAQNGLPVMSQGLVAGNSWAESVLPGRVGCALINFSPIVTNAL